MVKFGVAVVRGPLDVVPMTRLKVDEGSSALHVLADALHCTSVEAEEQISRLEAFTSFAGEGKTALGLDDLQDPISSFKSDGFKAIKAYLTTDTAASTEGNVRIAACTAACSAVRSFSPYSHPLELNDLLETCRPRPSSVCHLGPHPQFSEGLGPSDRDVKQSG